MYIGVFVQYVLSSSCATRNLALNGDILWKRSLLKGAAVKTQYARRSEATAADSLLPSATPLQLIDADGHPGDNPGSLSLPGPDVLVELHRRMVLGRRFDSQSTALAKQGRLAVYPSSRGQDACQVGAALALRRQDWLFPTYRDSMAVLTRGVPAEETLTLLRGDWHCGYDPYQYRVAPQCTPLATNTLHAVGLALRGHAEERGPGGAGAAWRRRDQRGRHPRGAQLRRRLEGPGGVPGAEQRVRDQRAAGEADRGADAGREGDRLRHPVAADRRQRRRRGLRGGAGRGVAGGGRRRPHADRGAHLPDRGAHQRRRRDPLPGVGGGQRVAFARPDRSAGGLPAGGRAA